MCGSSDPISQSLRYGWQRKSEDTSIQNNVYESRYSNFKTASIWATFCSISETDKGVQYAEAWKRPMSGCFYTKKEEDKVNYLPVFKETNLYVIHKQFLSLQYCKVL